MIYIACGYYGALADIDVHIGTIEGEKRESNQYNLELNLDISTEHISELSYEFHYMAPSYAMPPKIRYNEDFHDDFYEVGGKNEVKRLSKLWLSFLCKDGLKNAAMLGGMSLGVASAGTIPLVGAVLLGAVTSATGRYIGDKIGDKIEKYLESNRDYEFYQEKDWGIRSFKAHRASLGSTKNGKGDHYHLNEDIKRIFDQLGFEEHKKPPQYNERELWVKLDLENDLDNYTEKTYVSTRYRIDQEGLKIMPFQLDLHAKLREGNDTAHTSIYGAAIFDDNGLVEIKKIEAPIDEEIDVLSYLLFNVNLEKSQPEKKK